jgi:hypothetical protein
LPIWRAALSMVSAPFADLARGAVDGEWALADLARGAVTVSAPLPIWRGGIDVSSLSPAGAALSIQPSTGFAPVV